MKSFVNSAGTPFNVRVVQKGDAYGREDCLTHDEAAPVVEFYDAVVPGPDETVKPTQTGGFYDNRTQKHFDLSRGA